MGISLSWYVLVAALSFPDASIRDSGDAFCQTNVGNLTAGSAIFFILTFLALGVYVTKIPADICALSMLCNALRVASC